MFIGLSFFFFGIGRFFFFVSSWNDLSYAVLRTCSFPSPFLLHASMFFVTTTEQPSLSHTHNDLAFYLYCPYFRYQNDLYLIRTLAKVCHSEYRLPLSKPNMVEVMNLCRLSCLVVSCLVLSCLVLSRLVFQAACMNFCRLLCLVSPCLVVSSRLALSNRLVSCDVLSHLVLRSVMVSFLYCIVLTCFVLCCLVYCLPLSLVLFVAVPPPSLKREDVVGFLLGYYRVIRT